MRSSVFALLAACGSTSRASTAKPPSVPTDEVARPTEPAPIQQAALPAQAVAQPPARSSATCKAVADDIEKLGRQYAQLVNFRAADHGACTISYGYRTHRATTRGGWSSGVPHPDADGIWFYIGIYDPNGPDATSQIHTQPVVPNWWIGSRKVMFLILEGDKTTAVASAIMKVLVRHGLETR